MEDMDVVVVTDNKAFCADCIVHDKLRMECYPPILMGPDTKELLFPPKTFLELRHPNVGRLVNNDGDKLPSIKKI